MKKRVVGNRVAESSGVGAEAIKNLCMPEFQANQIDQLTWRDRS
jgi:hypothetical protein